MKKNIFLKLTFSFVFLCLSFGIMGQVTLKPVAVSPGSDNEIAVVFEICPTFSWSAVNGAASYRIVIFKVDDAKASSYDNLAAKASPLIIKDIPGRALSWTLPSEKRLKVGDTYGWFVRAMDAAGNEIDHWSNGKLFKVEEGIKYMGLEEKLTGKLKEHGVSDDDIKEIMADMKCDVKGEETDQHMGFIAEDVPILLATADRKGLSPMDVTAVLIKVVQKLEKDNEEYRKIISDLKERISKLEKK